jgi:hypothetical protein
MSSKWLSVDSRHSIFHGLKLVKVFRDEIWLAPIDMKILIRRLRETGGKIGGIDIAWRKDFDNKFRITCTVDYFDDASINLSDFGYYENCLNQAEVAFGDTEFYCGPTIKLPAPARCID